MKKFGIIILFTAILIQGFGQQTAAESQNDKKEDLTKKADQNTRVLIGDHVLKVEGNDSSVSVRVGNRGIDILESLEGSKVRVEKFTDSDKWDQDESDDRRERRRNRFHGHWTGIELGFNNYVTSDNTLVLPDDISYMSLLSGKSVNFNINFTQLSLGITRHIGIVTGLGLNWNNYKFDGNNNIMKGADGMIEELDPGANLDKSKLATIFLTLPVMLEFQLPVNSNHLNFAAGPIGAVKLGSHTKMVFEDGKKIKADGDFNLNMLRCGATARVGYGNFQLYGTYYKTPLFQTGKGPGGYDIYPFEIGMAFTFNN